MSGCRSPHRQSPGLTPMAAWGRGALLSRVGAMCLIELQKLRHDRSELVTRAIQPCLWLLIFGVTFTRLRAIPNLQRFLTSTSWPPAYLPSRRCSCRSSTASRSSGSGTPGVLAKLMVTPTPRSALVTARPSRPASGVLAQAPS